MVVSLEAMADLWKDSEPQSQDLGKGLVIHSGFGGENFR